MRFRVFGSMTITITVDVDAADEVEARAKAESAPTMSLCHQCAAAEPGEWRTSGELDGEPDIQSVEPLRSRRP